MCPLGSDQIEMIEYIQYYKERDTKIASKGSKKSNFPGPPKRKNVCTHFVCFQISDSHTYLQSRDVYFCRFHVAGFREVIDAQESFMKSVTWSRWRHEKGEQF